MYLFKIEDSVDRDFSMGTRTMIGQKFSVLIVDDSLDEVDDKGTTRKQHFMNLAFYFELSFATSLSHFNELVSEKVFDAFLVDYVLQQWGTTAETVLKQLQKRYPIALISSFWLDNFEKLRAFMFDHTEVEVIFCWDDLTNPQRRELMAFWLSKAIMEYRRLSPIRLGPNDPLRLLHISDFQFGGKNSADFATETHVMAEKIRQVWAGKEPTFIAMTGDIAEHGLPRQYTEAETWLNQFTNAIAPTWTKDRLLLIAGNHDICRSIGKAAGHPDLGEGIGQDLAPFAFMPFRQFAQKVTGRVDWSEIHKSFWIAEEFRQLGVLFFGYNTCETLNENGDTTRKVDDKQLAELFSEVRHQKKDSPPGTIVVGLVHHPLAPTKANQSVADPESFYRNMVAGTTWLILTGHVHEASAGTHDYGETEFLEIIAPTPTKLEAARPSDSLRGFNLIEFERNEGVPIRIILTACEFSGFNLVARPTKVFERIDLNGPFRQVKSMA